jgi:serine/threonine protein phosphatase PrpC
MDEWVIESAGITDRGRVRDNNEDAILLLPRHGVFCVADGMGGAEGGEVASHHTLETISETLNRSRGHLALEAKIRAVRSAINHASLWIMNWAAKKGTAGTGTTVVALILDDKSHRAAILHAGDSRAYRVRAGHIEQLIRDHSLASALNLENDDLVPVFLQNMITNAVGLHDKVELDAASITVKADDAFLLCSDGLNRMLRDDEIESVMNSHRREPIDEAVQGLVDAANRAGGRDNISVVAVRLTRRPPTGSHARV